MWLGAFYALLIYGRYWIPAITDSFELIGQTASGTGPMAPSDVFTRGIDIAGALMATSSTAAFFTNLGTSLAMIFTGIITALAFIAITVQFVVAMVESYIIVAAGFIFVGFGGSRWTAPYVERYIGLGVATGVKIMLLYLLIGTGMSLSVDWMTDAQKIAASASPAMSALEIMGASIIFMMLCWQIPKLFAAVLGGSPALSGGDLVASGAFVAGGAIAVGSMGLSALGCGGWCHWSPVGGWRSGFERSRRIGRRFRHTGDARLRGLKRRWRWNSTAAECAKSQSVQSIISAFRTTHRCGKESDRHSSPDLFPGATRLWPARNAAEVEH